MKAEEFVHKLKESAPKIEDYLKQGCNENFAMKNTISFIAKKKKNLTTYNDEVLKLLDCYEVNDLIIGQIKFLSTIEEKSNYYIIGEVEADWLILDKITGVLRVIELYSEQDLWPCAANGSKFLEALLMANNFFVKRSTDNDLYDDQKATCLVAEECSIIAGGDQFLDFYRMLLGCFE